METLNLKANNREITGKKVKGLRRTGFVPAIIYGKKVKSQTLMVDKKEFDKVYKEAGENALVELETESGKEKVLIVDIQRDPVTYEYLHVDFHKVKLDEKVKTEVPLEFENEEITPVVKELEGILVKEKTEIEVECLPTDIPHNIKVDVMVLKTFEDRVLVSDLKVPANVEILNEADEIVVLAKPPRSEEELEALDQEIVEDVAKVEVEAKTEEVSEEAKTEE